MEYNSHRESLGKLHNADGIPEWSHPPLHKNCEKGKKSQKVICIIDVFRGQMGKEFLSAMKENDVLVAFVPANCTDRLRPMDLSVQKAVKDRLKDKFNDWYSSQIIRQLDKGTDVKDLEPVNLRMSATKPLGAGWMVDVYKSIKADPRLVFNGFHKAGIADILEYKFPG